MNLIIPPTATMTSREIADLLDIRHDSVKRTMERLSEKGLVRFTPTVETSHSGAGARPAEVYLVNERDSYVVVAQLSPEFTARLVDYWQAHKNAGIPDFSNPAVAARAWAEQFEARQQAERTKAEIGSRREATAMNTASRAMKQVHALQAQLDQLSDHASVKRMEGHYKKSFPWRPLKKASERLNRPAIDVTDANYGSVKAYHADVWKDVYDIAIPK